jgi:hypothetical protein
MTASPLERVTDDLWAAQDTLRFLGLLIPVRMTVIRLQDGGLWLHSPLRLTEDLVAQVSALGPVQHLVAPSNLHHLFIGEWKSRFPDARMHGASGLAAKRPDLAFDAILGEAASTAPAWPAWENDIDHLRIEGVPRLDESVFLHRPSRTLLVTDLVFNLTRLQGLARFAFWLMGASGRVAQSPEWRLFTRDKQAVRQSMEGLLAWDFDRLVPAHGDIVPTGALPLVEQATAWMRRA